MKECSKCKESKNEDEFYKNARSGDGLQSRCKVCKSGVDQDYFKKNKKKLTNRYTSQRALRIKKYYDAIKQSGLTCCICNENDFACLDFHHIDPDKKEEQMSKLIQSHSWERITKELKKCAVVCKNCHSKIHTYGDEFVDEEFLNENDYDSSYGVNNIMLS